MLIASEQPAATCSCRQAFARGLTLELSVGRRKQAEEAWQRQRKKAQVGEGSEANPRVPELHQLTHGPPPAAEGACGTRTGWSESRQRSVGGEGHRAPPGGKSFYLPPFAKAYDMLARSRSENEYCTGQQLIIL